MTVFLWVLIVGLLSQNLVLPLTSTSLRDQKNYYGIPDPHTGSSPPAGGSYGTPTHGTRPSHSSGSHGTKPSHGSGSYGSTPPSHGGGGSYNPTPSNSPSGRNCGAPPRTPTPTPLNPPPSGRGGGYYSSPPTSSGGTPPTPVTVSPPTTPIIDPGTPSTPVIPPFLPAPSPPFIGTCNYWRSHPGVIWGLLGWWGTLGNAFGVALPGAGASLSFPEALSNTRRDGLGSLYREGTASFLNSMVNPKFPFTTKQVRDRFVAALGSNKAAASQAQVFKLANESLLKPRMPFWPYLKLVFCSWLLLPIFNGAAYIYDNHVRKYVKVGGYVSPNYPKEEQIFKELCTSPLSK